MCSVLSHKADGKSLQQIQETNMAFHIKPSLSLGVSPADPRKFPTCCRWKMASFSPLGTSSAVRNSQTPS